MDMRIEAARQRLLNANVPQECVEQEIALSAELGCSVDFIVWHLNQIAAVAERDLDLQAEHDSYMRQFQEV